METGRRTLRRCLPAAVVLSAASAACLLPLDDSAADRDLAAPAAPIAPPGADARPFGLDAGAALCTDFDRDPLYSGWTGFPDPLPGRIFELVDRPYLSPPHAARIGVSAMQTGDPLFQDLIW